MRQLGEQGKKEGRREAEHGYFMSDVFGTKHTLKTTFVIGNSNVRGRNVLQIKIRIPDSRSNLDAARTAFAFPLHHEEKLIGRFITARVRYQA